MKSRKKISYIIHNKHCRDFKTEMQEMKGLPSVVFKTD